MKLSFRVDSSEVTKTFNDLGRGLTSLQKPFTKAGDDLLRFYGVEVFDTQGGAIGENWRKLAASTLMARDRRTGYYKLPPVETGKKLIWTGAMKSGFKRQVAPKRLRIFNDVPYFKYHQKAGGKPPQRKMISLTPNVIETVVNHIVDYIEELV